MSYLSIKGILLDALQYIPIYKNYFIGMYVQKPTRYVIKFNPAVSPFVRKFAEEEPEYFEILDDFINIYMAKFFNMKVIPPSLFLRLQCLSVIMPDLVKFLQKNSAEINIFKTCQYFLQYASFRKVPLDFYPHLAFILLTDELNYRLTKIKDLVIRRHAEETLNTLKTLTVKSFMVLSKYVEISKEKIKTIGVKSKPTDIFIKGGVASGIKFFDGNNARVFIIIADRGTGKTIGLLRFIWSMYNQGYTVIIFGNDVRKEFRFASFKLNQSVDPTMYHILYEHGEKPQGLPIKIYTDHPKYPNEYSIEEFIKRPHWNRLKGIILFESEIFDEEKVLKEYEVGDKTKKTLKIIKKHRLSKVMKSFIRWRAENRTRKIAVALNEAQRIIGSVIDKETWEVAHTGESLFTEIRGLSCPVVLNTQYLSRLKKSGQQFDVLFASYLTNMEERTKLANIYGMKNLRTVLGIQELKDKKMFFMIHRNKMSKIKFLVPPCMPENNKYTLDELYEKEWKDLSKK
jgi:hypothetical protein